MPRPKRTKVAPSARVSSHAKPAPTVAAGSSAPRVSPNDIYDVSDPEDGSRTSVKGVTRSNGKEKSVATSPQGRGAGTTIRDVGEAAGRPGPNRQGSVRKRTEVPSESAICDDVEVDTSSPSMEVGRRESRTPAVENTRLSMANFRRRPRQPSILGRGPVRTRSSSAESIRRDDDGLATVARNTASASAMGASTRRPRQPSIVRQNGTAAVASSLGFEVERGTPAHSTSILNIGNFKRRAREPSILGTAQKKRQPRPDSDSNDDEEDDEFNPEDESTPLNLSKGRTITSSSVSPESSSSNPRKRKLSAVSRAVQVEETRPETLSDGENESLLRSSPEEVPMPSIEARSVTPEPMSETMALPQSSSSSPSSIASGEMPLPARSQVSRGTPVRGRRMLRGRASPPRTQDSPISSPPSLTHSPNRPVATAKSRQAKQVPPPSAFSTAQLRTLMPQRRRRAARDQFEIPSSGDEVDTSGLASDDDELSHVVARTRRSTRTPAQPRKPRAKPGAKPTEPSAKRTYGSRPSLSSEKENEEVDPDDSLAPLPDDDGNNENSQELEKRVGLELKRAARKFAEVDQWELEFEEITASSSSPKDAR